MTRKMERLKKSRKPEQAETITVHDRNTRRKWEALVTGPYPEPD
jgi:hypothetical protein